MCCITIYSSHYTLGTKVLSHCQLQKKYTINLRRVGDGGERERGCDGENVRDRGVWERKWKSEILRIFLDFLKSGVVREYQEVSVKRIHFFSPIIKREMHINLKIRSNPHIKLQAQIAKITDHKKKVV